MSSSHAQPAPHSDREGPSDERWAVVLGGSRGLGFASARRLALDGYNLCLVYRESRAQLATLKAPLTELERLGPNVLHFNVDALSQGGRTNVLDSLERAVQPNGRIAVLVHSLAKGTLKPLCTEVLPDKEWPEGGGDRDAFVKAWTQTSGAAVAPGTSPLSVRDVQLTIEAMGLSLLEWVKDLRERRLLAGDTRVVALTSEGVRRAWPGYGAVAAAKAVLESLVRSLALELGPFGVRANCVQAGVTDTQALRQIPNNEALKLHAVARNPMGRLTTPDDVGQVVALLCRPEAAWINGTLVIADGGEHLC